MAKFTGCRQNGGFYMMSHILRDARKYEETMEKQIAKEVQIFTYLRV